MFRHFGQRPEAFLLLPILRQLDHVAGPLCKHLQASLIYSLQEGVKVSDTTSLGQRATLVVRKRDELNNQNIGQRLVALPNRTIGRFAVGALKYRIEKRGICFFGNSRWGRRLRSGQHFEDRRAIGIAFPVAGTT